jgi:transcriptional regulator with XRE-family HTH domain
MLFLWLPYLRINAGLSPTQLAYKAGLDPSTVLRAERGEIISAASAKKIADALSRIYGEKLRVTEIAGLNVRQRGKPLIPPD